MTADCRCVTTPMRDEISAKEKLVTDHYHTNRSGWVTITGCDLDKKTNKFSSVNIRFKNRVGLNSDSFRRILEVVNEIQKDEDKRSVCKGESVIRKLDEKILSWQTMIAAENRDIALSRRNVENMEAIVASLIEERTSFVMRAGEGD